MSDDAKKAPEAPRWAADEPTAMWDDGALREKGYEGVADAKPTNVAPATRPDVGGEDARSVHTAPVAASPKAAPQSSGLSWPMTLGVAALVAAIVFVVVRLLR